jgi:hypothetical protein
LGDAQILQFAPKKLILETFALLAKDGMMSLPNPIEIETDGESVGIKTATHQSGVLIHGK